MEEKLNNNKEPIKKSKTKKAKVTVITLSTILVLTLGMQVYASTNGYGNVFFMIKNLITTGTLSGDDKIFSDKDITLSYKSIDLAEGLKIQVNRLEVKNGKTKIYALIKAENGEKLPLTYKVTTLFTDGAETAEKEIKGKEAQSANYSEYEDVLDLDYEVNENAIITIAISDKDNVGLRTLEINMQSREITVTGEKQFEKISQIELKKYLNLFSTLNNGAGQNDNLLYMAEDLIEVGGEYEGYGIIPDDVLGEALRNNNRIELINEIIKEIYGDKAKFEMVKNAQGKDVEVLKGEMDGWKYDKQHDLYTALTAGEDYHRGKCLKIEDVSYENGIYTVKFVYILATGYDEDSENLENLEQYETTIKLKRNEDSKYSKYQIVSLEEGTKIKDKVSTKVEDNTEISVNTNNGNNNTNTTNNSSNTQQTNTENNNTSTSSERDYYINTSKWVEVWPEWIGMKFKLPEGFTREQVVQNGNNSSVNITGNITLQDRINGIRRFPVIIRFYNEFDENLKEEEVLIYDMDRNVKSTDNKGWTDWMPLKEEYIPGEAPAGYIRRGYARVRDDQIEKVIFDMKTTGIDVDHYTFMNNVLGSISSTSV